MKMLSEAGKICDSLSRKGLIPRSHAEKKVCDVHPRLKPTQNIGVGEAATRSLFFAIAGKSSNTKSSEMAGRKGMVDTKVILKMATLEIPILQI